MLTWIQIDRKSIEHNIKQLQSKTGNNCLFMPVIKANAYGHGFFEVAEICQKNNNVDRICVVNSDEALKLVEKYKKTKPIQILSFFDLNEKILLKLAKKPIIFPLYSLKQAKILNKVGERAKKDINVHIKLDVGTSRVGVTENSVIDFIKNIKKYKKLNIEGVFGHLSSSEDNRKVTIKQLNLFKNIVEKIKKLGINPEIKHLACSAASILYPNTHFNAVRVGLSVYGLHPSSMTNKKINLKPTLSWFTKIILLKQVPSETHIGYDQSFKTKRPTKVATLPVGYYDGFDRLLSNKGEVLVRGIKCSVIGKVCMNLTMIDVTNVPDVKDNDEVVLIGSQKNATITAEDMAQKANTINYEIVDRINSSIPRIVK